MGERPEIECRRGEDRGAAPMRVSGMWREEGVSRAGCGMGIPLPTEDGSGRVLCVLPRKKNPLCISYRRILVQIECFLYSSS